MIPFDQSFNYQPIERVQTPDGRKYLTPSGALASVTTILGKTQSQDSKDGLKKWADRIGHKNAQDITQGAANLGSVIHNNLENYILGQPMKTGNNTIYVMAAKMINTVIAQGLPKIQKIYGLEVPLYYESLFAGTADIIAEIDGCIQIADFKNTIKMKKEEWLESYYIQTTAYAMAHDQMFDTQIDRARIMMVARPNKDDVCDYKEFDLDPIKFQKYQDKWIEKLDQFYGG